MFATGPARFAIAPFLRLASNSASPRRTRGTASRINASNATYFYSGLSAQIASAGALTIGRHAGSLGDSRISSERLPGLRIERSCPIQTVVFLELIQGSPRLGT